VEAQASKVCATCVSVCWWVDAGCVRHDS
jgi:hypothetical protein